MVSVDAATRYPKSFVTRGLFGSLRPTCAAKGRGGSTALLCSVFVGIILAAALGFRLHRVRPLAAPDEESRSSMRIALGLTSTLTAVVLGLVAASAMNDYERANAMVSGLAIDARPSTTS